MVALGNDEDEVEVALEAEEYGREPTVTCGDCLEAHATETAYWQWVDQSIDEARGK